MQRDQHRLPSRPPWQLLPSSLPRHYFRRVTRGVALFAVLAWIVLHHGTNPVAHAAWILLQIAALVACPALTALGIRALLTPVLASPRWGALLRAAGVATLVITFACTVLGEVLLDFVRSGRIR